MSIRSRMPSAVEPYLQLPPEVSLTLLTGTLGCSPHWLTALFIGNILRPKAGTDPDARNNVRYGVILVSWLRDVHFWKDEIRRTTGLDISKLSQEGNFAFLDCLSTQTTFDASDTLGHAEKIIGEAISKLSTNVDSRLLLILDNPDVLLATQSATAQQLNLFIMKVRTRVQSIVMSCSADLPLLSASIQPTTTYQSPMEMETSAFVIRQSHNARLLMSVRELLSGAARDVSGVLRVTGGSVYGLADTTEQDVREIEVLYLVQRDGNVKVFGRGEGSA